MYNQYNQMREEFMNLKGDLRVGIAKNLKNQVMSNENCEQKQHLEMKIPTKLMHGFLSLVVGLTLLSGSKAQALANNDELKIGITQEFESMNPLIMTMTASTYMYYLLGRQPVIFTVNGKWVPQLIKGIPTLENKQAKLINNADGSKGLEATFELLENAKWGDGTPVTCNDLKFTWQTGLNTTVSIGNREPYENIKDVTWDAKTPKKCVVTFAKAKWDFARNLFPFLPAHIEAPILEKHGKVNQGYDQNSEYNKNPTNPGLYNGPYIVSEMKLGSHLTMVPNPHFYGKAPQIKKIIFKLIPNTGTLEANLRSGTIDMVSTLGFSFDQALAFEKKIKADALPYRLLFKEGIVYEHIDFNLENPVLSDVRVRQAIIHAINREEITKALFEGKQKVAVHNLNPLDPNFTADPKKIKLYPYSKRDAVKLLDEAGWKVGSDGIRTKDGQRLSLPFMTTSGNKTRETVQTMIQGQLRSVGVEVIIKNEPARVFFGETMQKRKFGGMAMYAWTSVPEQTPRSTYHSAMIQTEKNGWSGQNNMAWKNAKVDQLIEKYETEFNPAKRKQIIHEFLGEYTKEAPVIPLYYRAENATIPKNMLNYEIAGHLFYESNEGENWSLSSTMK